MRGVSRAGLLGLIAVDLTWLSAIARLRGAAAFILLIGGVIALCAGAVRRGADSRDGGDWKPILQANVRRRGASGLSRALTPRYVNAQIDRLEERFRE